MDERPRLMRRVSSSSELERPRRVSSSSELERPCSSSDLNFVYLESDFEESLVTVRDEAQKAARLYGTFGWPETYVIDRQGVIRRKFIGAVDWNSPEVTDYLSKL